MLKNPSNLVSNPQDAVRMSASTILAIALVDLLPGIHLEGGGATASGFYYDLSFSANLSKNFFPVIEERMRLITKEKRPFKWLEMVPENACDYLKSKKLKKQAQKALRFPRDLIGIIQVSSFVDIFDGEPVKDSGDIKHFKLLDLVRIDKKIRIIGACFDTKEELKDFAKVYKSVCGKTQVDLFKNTDVLSLYKNGLIWHPAAERIRLLLVNFWVCALKNAGYQMISTPVEDLISMAKCHFLIGQKKHIKTAEIKCVSRDPFEEDEILDPLRGFVDQSYISCHPIKLAQELNSSLQFIVKILNMLSLSFEVYVDRKQAHAGLIAEALKVCECKVFTKDLWENSIQFELSDVTGKRWSGPYLKIDVKKATITQSLFNSLERFFALLYEKSEGAIVNWTSVEQVRIIQAQNVDSKRLYMRLKDEGFRVFVETEFENLNHRLDQALQERIPCCIVLDGQEGEPELLPVRFNGSNEIDWMNLETLICRLRTIEKK